MRKRWIDTRRDWPLWVWGAAFGVGIDIANSMRQLWQTIAVVVTVVAGLSPFFLWAVRRRQRHDFGSGSTGCGASGVMDGVDRGDRDESDNHGDRSNHGARRG